MAIWLQIPLFGKFLSVESAVRYNFVWVIFRTIPFKFSETFICNGKVHTASFLTSVLQKVPD